MPEKERSKRSAHTSGGSGREERKTMSRAHSLRSLKSGEDRGRSRDESETRRRSSSQRGMPRSGSARSLRSSGRPSSRERSKRSGGGSDHKRGGSERGVRTTGGGAKSAPLERQTSNNEDSMAMLLGLAGKKKPRKRSDSDSSSSASSASTRSSKSGKGGKGGPPLTGEKSKPKSVRDGPLLKRAVADQKTKEDEALALDLSNRSGRKNDDDTSSYGSSRVKGRKDDDSANVLSVSKLAFPTSDSKKNPRTPEKNAFVSRPDLRNVDQSVNLRDMEAGRKGRQGMFNDTSSTSFTSNNSSTYSRNNSFSRNKKNPYLKVSPMENAIYSVKSFCRSLFKALCHKNCLAIMGVILIVAIILPFVVPKNKVISESALLVPSEFGTSDAMVHPIIDTIEKEGITYLVPVVSKEEAEERAEAIQKMLIEHDMATALHDEYAREALQWIAEYDPAKISLHADEGAILQRYALAVFFFATHPGTTANRTTDQALKSHVSKDSEEEADKEVVKHEEQDERRIDSFGANWMIDENICTWQGVDCLHDNRVVLMNMTGTQLQGTLPIELTLLKELTRVDFSDNFLEGPLPDIYVERLNKMEYLALHDNLLTGTIPQKIGDWSSLAYLNLAQNKFSGKLPESIDELSNLQLFFCQENLLSGGLPTLEGMKALEYLYLNNNDLSGPLPHEMFKDKGLVDVRLEYNSLTGPIPDGFHKLHALEVLSLGNNDLTGSIPDIFDHTANIIALDLHKNELTGTLPASLGKLTAIEHLLLDNNKLSGTIADDWFAMPKLRTLVLHHNKIEGTISGSISALSNLQDLWLNHNAFVGSIPEDMGKCSSLVNVYLHDNDFSGTLPTTFDQLERLGSLRIYHSELTGTISAGICSMRKDKSLSYIAADCESAVECDCCDKCY